MSVEPFSLHDAATLLEHVFPSQKISAESFKEQMAVHGKALTALGSYWKGRKPLVLNKAIILGALLPSSDNPDKDLRIFDLLMGMDDESLVRRLDGRRELGGQDIAEIPFLTLVDEAKRAEKVPHVHDHIWQEVNDHLGTRAESMVELVEQLGVMRFGKRPSVGDAFAGSGQVPFEAARLGCDAYAADLNPVACMLSWGAFNVVGASPEDRARIDQEQEELADWLECTMDELGFESDNRGWKAKAFLYCLEARCPETGWMVPLLPSRIISKQARTIVRLVPDPVGERYEIEVHSACSDEEYESARVGTVRDDGSSGEAMLVHTVDGTVYRTPMIRIRGDGRTDTPSGSNLRLWERTDVAPRPDDVYQERLYAVQWAKQKSSRSRVLDYEFRSVTTDDLARERGVAEYVQERIERWQAEGLVPDMRIETGKETSRLVRERGWTHWHHFFNPRQLLTAALIRSRMTEALSFRLTQVLNNNCRSSRWHPGQGGGGGTVGVFDNQALNSLYNYGTRGTLALKSLLKQPLSRSPLPSEVATRVETLPADAVATTNDLWITDPPYGNAVAYEEILEFFIAWFRRNPPSQFAQWVWDSRRSLAITGEDSDFKSAMIDAYANLANHMPHNGLQVLMFTHQSGQIWSDMASIVWGAGLCVTAAWYVTTETSSSLRQGAYVKGTVLLVLRRRTDEQATFQDELAYELEVEVKKQVEELVGLNQRLREQSARNQNTFNDADLQMAGYAAALRVLTRYSAIDGRDMVAEAKRPRVKGETTTIDSLIEHAVNIANSALVPKGIEEGTWRRLNAIERFYLKMLEQESHGVSALGPFQQFAKAFRVRDSQPVMASIKANKARLKTSSELGRSEMHEGSDFGGTPLRGVLFAMHQLSNDADRDKVLAGLHDNVPDYYNQRDHVRALAKYLHITLADMRPDEAERARLVDLFVMNENL